MHLLQNRNEKKMKIKITLLLIGLLGYISGVRAQLSSVELRALGLTCSMCSNAIFKQLETIPGVDSVSVDLNTNTFYVTLSPDNSLNPLIFKDKVEAAGFFIGYFAATASMNQLQIDPYVIIENTQRDLGLKKFQVLDKGFVSEKEFKKLKRELRGIKTYNKGIGSHFHVKILQA